MFGCLQWGEVFGTHFCGYRFAKSLVHLNALQKELMEATKDRAVIQAELERQVHLEANAKCNALRSKSRTDRVALSVFTDERNELERSLHNNTEYENRITSELCRAVRFLYVEGCSKLDAYSVGSILRDYQAIRMLSGVYAGPSLGNYPAGYAPAVVGHGKRRTFDGALQGYGGMIEARSGDGQAALEVLKHPKTGRSEVVDAPAGDGGPDVACDDSQLDLDAEREAIYGNYGITETDARFEADRIAVYRDWGMPGSISTGEDAGDVADNVLSVRVEKVAKGDKSVETADGENTGNGPELDDDDVLIVRVERPDEDFEVIELDDD